MTALPIPGCARHGDAFEPERRHLLLATGAIGGTAMMATAVPFVASLGPSERAKSMGAPVEVDFSSIAPGALKIIEWRGKPVWIQRRTDDMIASLRGQESRLVDPHSRLDLLPDAIRNGGRSIRPDIFVAIGVCTHLGCSPTPVRTGESMPGLGADWRGGFFCPCHGSTFDLAGRVFKDKPAPTNLEIPPHRFHGDSRLVIGHVNA